VPEQKAKLPLGAREKVFTDFGAVSGLIIRHFGRHPHLTGEMRVFFDADSNHFIPKSHRKAVPEHERVI
jgi:hypothetical protein